MSAEKPAESLTSSGTGRGDAEALAAVNALTEKLERYYDFQCTGGPLRSCVDWVALKLALANLVQDVKIWKAAAEKYAQRAAVEHARAEEPR
jgi:hypothetical protein